MKLLPNFNEQAQKVGNEHLYVIYNCPLPLQDDIRILTTHPEMVLICDSCQRKLNNSASVLLDGEPRRDYCFTCFARNGTDNFKRYYARPNMNMSLTEEGWNVQGELLLMNALLKLGYGNWHKIKNYLDYHGHNFTSGQIERHYNLFYMTRDLKPALTDGFHEWDHLNPYKHEPVPIKEEVLPQKTLPDVTWQAYNPKRQQHLMTYNPQAENLICDLQISPSDSAEEVEIKMLKLQEYAYLVKERQKRQDFVVEHQILSEEHHKLLLSEGKAKNQARKQIEKYSRFLTHQEAEQLASHLSFQNTLKATILELSSTCGGDRHPSFTQKYKELLDKKQAKTLKKGTCPIDLKLMPISSQVKEPFESKNELDEEKMLQKIRQLEFIDKNVKITVLNKPQRR